ncbi:methyl-accepting chemotaxis protein [Bacillus sp. CGMCC 1.16607]|uniref:methyl-accepting chemotaxis protein n=1 Tax=Bacillus sp. CGMCC 1.16607 TaxID=3351842 RepID=UPI00363A13C5
MKGARFFKRSNKQPKAKKTESFKNVRLEKWMQFLSSAKLWNRLKLGQKYGIALFITIGLFAISTVITFILLSSVQDKMVRVEKTGVQAIRISEAAAIFHQKGVSIGNYIIDSNPKHLKNFEELSKELQALKAEIRKGLSTQEEKTLFIYMNKNDEQLNLIFTGVIMPEVKLLNEREYRLGKLKVDNLIEENVQKLDALKEILQKDQKNAVTSATASLVLTLMVLVISVIVSMVLGIITIVIIGRLISKKLNHIVSVSNEIAAGNLHVELQEYKGKDEIAALSKATSLMKEQLSTMIQEISSVSNHVNNKSGELNVAASEVRASSQQVASTMQELSSGAEVQANHASELSEIMDDYLRKVNEATESGEVIRKSSNDVLVMTQKGNTLMRESQQQMVKINHIMKSSVDKVQGLDDQTKQISKLVKVIHEIAGQTNLLALNAAIEAARAGEHGRGFAVVADEVRKLAEQVSFSVSDITKIVQGIQTESNNVVHSLQAGYSEVEEGTNQIEITGQTFKEIYEAVTLMTDKVKEISDSLEQVAKSSVSMNASIENIASISEESAAGIEQTSASVTQTNHSMEEISENAGALAELSDQLNSMISKFKLS